MLVCRWEGLKFPSILKCYVFEEVAALNALHDEQRLKGANESEAHDSRDLFPELSAKGPHQGSDPMVLWGAWPGNEPLKSLLAELD